MATTGTTRAKSPSVEAMLDALGQHPGATAAELAEAAGIGRSTASKTLAGLEAEGRVTRQRSMSEGGKPTPDRWTLAPDTPGTPADRAEAAPQPAAAREPVAEPTDATQIASEDGERGGEAAPPATGTPDPAEAERTTATMPDVEPPAGEDTGSPRLRPGALRTLVHAWLADRPGQAFTPGRIGKELGRSAGAVGNALATMTAAGEVVQTQVKPRRYAIAEGGDQAGATR